MHLDMHKCDSVMLLVSFICDALCDSAMLLVRSYEPSTWLCSCVMRFQSYPQLDPCAPQSL